MQYKFLMKPLAQKKYCIKGLFQIMKQKNSISRDPSLQRAIFCKIAIQIQPIKQCLRFNTRGEIKATKTDAIQAQKRVPLKQLFVINTNSNIYWINKTSAIRAEICSQHIPRYASVETQLVYSHASDSVCTLNGALSFKHGRKVKG